MPCLSWLVNARSRGVRGSGPPGFRRGLDATDRASLFGSVGKSALAPPCSSRCGRSHAHTEIDRPRHCSARDVWAILPAARRATARPAA